MKKVLFECCKPKAQAVTQVQLSKTSWNVVLLIKIQGEILLDRWHIIENLSLEQLIFGFFSGQTSTRKSNEKHTL